MYKTDADGQEWVLRTANGNAHIGSHYADFRGDMCILVGGRPPHKSGSTGFIHVTDVPDGPVEEYYAGVCGMEWTRVVPTHRAGKEL